MNDEVWKTLDNFKNYEISSFGNIKNKITKRILNPGIKSGYLCINLTNDNGDRKYCKMHRLVALTFIPNPLNKETVNHKDHNKLNNNLSDGNKENACKWNLEWCSAIENQIHKVNSGLSNSTKKVAQYDLQLNKIKEFNSQKEASKELNICYSSISKCCLEKLKTAGGFIFRFKLESNAHI